MALGLLAAPATLHLDPPSGGAVHEEPLATAFDPVDFHLARMDRQGVSTSALSLVFRLSVCALVP